MTLRNILIHPDPRLKAKCSPIVDFTKDLAALSEDMLETMYAAPGIGLAAPQIGIMQRLIVMDCVKEEGGTPEPMVLINPEAVVKDSHRCCDLPQNRVRHLTDW